MRFGGMTGGGGTWCIKPTDGQHGRKDRSVGGEQEFSLSVPGGVDISQMASVAAY